MHCYAWSLRPVLTVIRRDIEFVATESIIVFTLTPQGESRGLPDDISHSNIVYISLQTDVVLYSAYYLIIAKQAPCVESTQ